VSRSTKQHQAKSHAAERTQDIIQNKTLEGARQKFEAGNYKVILKCMYICMKFRIQPPVWLAEAFCNRVGSPENFETWDDAFGPPMPRGTKRARREEIKDWAPLALEIYKLRAKGIRGQAQYEQAAKVFSGRWETVRDAYYREPKYIRDMMEYLFRFMEARVREKIFSPDGQCLVSPEELDSWLENYFETHKPKLLSS
jgi:hypothetical protein